MNDSSKRDAHVEYGNLPGSSSTLVGEGLIKYIPWNMHAFCYVLLGLNTSSAHCDLCARLVHILLDSFTGTGVISRLPQCQWTNPDEYGHNRSDLKRNKPQQRANHAHNAWKIQSKAKKTNWTLHVPRYLSSISFEIWSEFKIKCL